MKSFEGFIKSLRNNRSGLVHLYSRRQSKIHRLEFENEGWICSEGVSGEFYGLTSNSLGFRFVNSSPRLILVLDENENVTDRYMIINTRGSADNRSFRFDVLDSKVSSYKEDFIGLACKKGKINIDLAIKYYPSFDVIYAEIFDEL